MSSEHKNARPTDLQPGDIIGEGYVIEHLLGGGGMGQVYLARDPRLDRLVAVKLLHAEVATTDEADARFRREARALSRVLHPNVVGIHAFGRRDDTWYLVMEYVEGSSLEARLEKGPLPLREVLAIARQVASGLQEAHALGIVHRDVKPGNILLRPLASGGTLAKVCDFGLARQFNEQKATAVTQEATILGTPAYMSPEQIQAQPVDGRSDLYSLAIMVFQMVTGMLPYRRDSLQGLLIAHLIDEMPPLGDEVPPAFERELRKALSKAPEERHATVMAFADALDNASDLTTPIASADAVSCPGCGQASYFGGGFCTRCGSPVPLARCGTCGAKREGERYHCTDCGAALLAWPAGAGAGAAELRMAAAAVLVARLECPAGDLPAQAEFAAMFAAAVAREGGRTAALVGMEGIALWGLGGMRDGDVAAAVDAALALPARMVDSEAASRGATLRVAVELGLTASRGVGVAWGMALAGGEAVELARESVRRGAPGSVALGETAFREVRGQFEVRAEASSRRRIVLRRRDATLALADYIARDVARPLVGREVEIALLSRAARKVRRDRCLVAVPVRGAADVGKSRLCGELLRRLEVEEGPWRLHVLRCGAVGAPTAWQPFIDLVRGALADAPEADLGARLGQLPGLDDGDPARLQRRVQALSRMLGLDRAPADSRVPEPASEAELQAAFEAWVALVRGLCQQQAMAIVVEGLQHARPGTLSLIGHIARNCEDMPLLLLLPVRDDRAEAVLGALQLPAARTAPVELEALELAETGQLVRELLDGFEPPAALIDALHRFSDGMPGQVEQAVDTLMDEGVLAATGQGWALRSEAAVAGLLERSMAELLLRRVGRLPPPERQVLEALSVAGGSAPLGMLGAMLQRDIGEGELARLRQAGLAVPSRTQSFAGQREWTLRHTVLAALLVDGLGRSVRVDLHRRAAEWLARWPGPRPARLGALIADHYREAGDGPEASRLLLRNAEDAVRAFANRDAFDAFDAAANVAAGWLAAQPYVSEARETLAVALVGLAQTGMRVGELARALDATASAIDVCGDDEDLEPWRLRARRLRGQVLDGMGKPDEAIAALRLAVDDARRQSSGFAASIFGISLIAMVLQRRGRHAESTAIAEQALAQCTAAGHLEDVELFAGVGRLHTWLGHGASRSGDFARAQEAYRAAQAAFHRCGDDIGAAMAELSLGNVAYRAGQLAEAERVYRDVSRTCKALDDVIGVATAETNLGNVLLDLGRADEALEALRTSERTQRRIGRLENLPETLRLIALALAAKDQRPDARQAASEALELAQRFGQTASVAAVKDVQGRLG